MRELKFIDYEHFGKFIFFLSWIYFLLLLEELLDFIQLLLNLKLISEKSIDAKEVALNLHVFGLESEKSQLLLCL